MREPLSKSAIEAILARCKFGDWRFAVRRDTYHAGRLYLQLQWTTRCNRTRKPARAAGRKWWLSEFMTPSEIVQTAFLAVLTAVEHEAREQFTYRGLSIFDPHYDVEQLFDLRAAPGALEVRR